MTSTFRARACSALLLVLLLPAIASATPVGAATIPEIDGVGQRLVTWFATSVGGWVLVGGIAYGGLKLATSENHGGATDTIKRIFGAVVMLAAPAIAVWVRASGAFAGATL